METCVFCKIANKELPATFLYQDEQVMVFNDIHPVREFHVLIVPKTHIVDTGAVEEIGIFAKLFEIAKKVITQEKLNGKGYRIVINGGGAQLIDHLHLHLMAPVTKTAKM
ncbi:HIT domain-containing protein [Candidatus Shapirobacteria bacterium]|nr:HIT domain-containing protein [Candidatus Shapirobacteria bacterium]